MRRLFVALFLTFAVPAAVAGDAPPWVKTQVPDPIPSSFNECVRVLWLEKAKHDRRVSIWDPPFSESDLSALEAIRARRLGKLELCNEQSS